MFAADGQYRMHETLVSISEMEDDILESVLGLRLDGEDIAEPVDVVFPEDLVLYGLDSVKERLQRDARETPTSHTF